MSPDVRSSSLEDSRSSADLPEVEDGEEEKTDPRLHRKKRQAIYPFYPAIFSTRRSRRRSRSGTAIFCTSTFRHVSLLSDLHMPSVILIPTTPTPTFPTHTLPLLHSTTLEFSLGFLLPPPMYQDLLLPPQAHVAVMRVTLIACPTATTTSTCKAWEWGARYSYHWTFAELLLKVITITVETIHVNSYKNLSV